MQGSLPAVHPQARFAATPIDGAMAWLTVHWPMPDFCSFCPKAINRVDDSGSSAARFMSTPIRRA
jgi:hypothetical protein